MVLEGVLTELIIPCKSEISLSDEKHRLYTVILNYSCEGKATDTTRFRQYVLFCSGHKPYCMCK